MGGGGAAFYAGWSRLLVKRGGGAAAGGNVLTSARCEQACMTMQVRELHLFCSVLVTKGVSTRIVLDRSSGTN